LVLGRSLRDRQSLQARKALLLSPEKEVACETYSEEESLLDVGAQQKVGDPICKSYTTCPECVANKHTRVKPPNAGEAQQCIWNEQCGYCRATKTGRAEPIWSLTPDTCPDEQRKKCANMKNFYYTMPNWPEANALETLIQLFSFDNSALSKLTASSAGQAPPEKPSERTARNWALLKCYGQIYLVPDVMPDWKFAEGLPAVVPIAFAHSYFVSESDPVLNWIQTPNGPTLHNLYVGTKEEFSEDRATINPPQGDFVMCDSFKPLGVSAITVVTAFKFHANKEFTERGVVANPNYNTDPKKNPLDGEPSVVFKLECAEGKDYQMFVSASNEPEPIGHIVLPRDKVKGKLDDSAIWGSTFVMK